jgi:hypothetical protein
MEMNMARKKKNVKALTIKHHFTDPDFKERASALVLAANTGPPKLRTEHMALNLVLSVAVVAILAPLSVPLLSPIRLLTYLISATLFTAYPYWRRRRWLNEHRDALKELIHADKLLAEDGRQTAMLPAARQQELAREEQALLTRLQEVRDELTALNPAPPPLIRDRKATTP